MKKKNRLAVFALTATILLSGCSLSKEQVPEQVIEPVIITSEETTKIGGFDISKSVVMAPSTEEEKQELIRFISSLEGENQVVLYQSESSTTKALIDESEKSKSITQDQTNSREIFEASLKENPMVQIYYCGNSISEKEEKSIALYYPNVTYVEEDEEVNEVISTYYRANYVTGTCINGLRSGVDKVESFDFEGTIDSVKGHLPDIDKQEVIDGLEAFSEYVENTTLFQKCESLSDKVEDALRPYVESAIPALENAWDSAKPYLEDGKDKVTGIYEDVKPELDEAYQNAKEYVKSILGK